MSAQSLPVELLHHIFSLVCIPCHRHRRPPAEAVAPALGLGRICRNWRTVVWGMPELWEQLDIVEFKRDHGGGLGNEIDLIREWIQRVQGRLSTISVSPSCRSYWQHSPLPIFKLLTSHSTTWKSLYLHITCDCTLFLKAFARGRVPCLETLYIKRDSVGKIERYGPALDFIADAPSLTVIDYEGHCLPAASITQPWPRLVSLTEQSGFGDIGDLQKSVPTSNT
ncbi:hypothetical protein CVT26_008270 [Gymnopilus dilepis]|uniref:Uncharacterized protein n=1 Tax=Gymnopilus dilepis TaxID=231916 RepID=A0A409WPG0_9AGAR|nr:hypothetical protein CVT26_008270 [Gymnopilus dilepis]